MNADRNTKRPARVDWGGNILRALREQPERKWTVTDLVEELLWLRLGGWNRTYRSVCQSLGFLEKDGKVRVLAGRVYLVEVDG